jgi:hypothetical protein
VSAAAATISRTAEFLLLQRSIGAAPRTQSQPEIGEKSGREAPGMAAGLTLGKFQLTMRALEFPRPRIGKNKFTGGMT